VGTTSTVAEFVGKMNKASATLAHQDKPLLAAVIETKKIIKASMAKAIGGDMRMGKKRINIRDDKIRRGYIVRATGPAHLIERNTSPHRIAPKRRRGRGRGRGVLAIPGIGFRPYVNHPGTTGKHPFEKGAKAAVRPAAIAYRKAAMTDLLKVFGG
jgi:hypothetical protein